MRQFGYSMGGTEGAIEERVNRIIKRFGRLDYVEVGIGEGQTMLAVSDIASEQSAPWCIVGIDLLNGRHFNPHKYLNNSHRNITISNSPCKIYDGSISVWLSGSPHSICYIPFPIGYALVDACHCKDCTIADFLQVEKKVREGGIVAFHDAGEKDQVDEPQCRPDRGIRVIEAMKELGLLDGSRPGWRLDHEASGDRSTVFFEKVA